MNWRPPLATVLNVIEQYAVEEICGWIERVDVCIAGTAILLLVFRHFGFVAVEQPVTLMAMNERMWQAHQSDEIPEDLEERYRFFDRTGAWGVGLGYGTDGRPGFDGHLVVFLKRAKLIIDVSILQTYRPEHDIIPPPIVIHRVDESFVRGGVLVLQMPGAVLAYQKLENDAYRTASDWTVTELHRKAARALIRRIEKEGKR